MHQRYMLAMAIGCLTISAHAAEPKYFRLSELLDSPSVKEFQDPNVKLYWGTQPTPAFREVARPDDYTRPGLSFLGEGCVEAFERTLKSMIGNARTRGYDAIINIRIAHDGKPSDDLTGFSCDYGHRSTEVSLIGSFAMTPAAFQRAAEAEQQSVGTPPRPPAKGAIYLPLEPILTSPEARDILGKEVIAHWGIAGAPAYSERFGPEEYSDEADVRKLGNEGACKQAVLKALNSMVEDAKERKFDSIIKIRSVLNEQYAPVATDVECELDKKEASVTLQASLASKK